MSQQQRLQPHAVLFDHAGWRRAGGVNYYTDATVSHRVGDELRFFGMTPFGHALLLAGLHWSHGSTRLGWWLDGWCRKATRWARRKARR